MYSYRGEEYTWIFDYDNGLQLHQYCVELFQEAKRLAEKAGRKAYEATRKKLAPKTKPEEKEEETNENW